MEHWQLVILVLHIGVNQHLYLPLYAYRSAIYVTSPILSIFNTIFLFQFLALLIGSMPDMPMAKWARQMMWVFIVSELIQLLIEVGYVGLSPPFRLILISSRSPAPALQRYSMVALCLLRAQTLVSLAVTGIWIPFLMALRRRFGEQLVLARGMRWRGGEYWGNKTPAGGRGLMEGRRTRRVAHFDRLSAGCFCRRLEEGG